MAREKLIAFRVSFQAKDILGKRVRKSLERSNIHSALEAAHFLHAQLFRDSIRVKNKGRKSEKILIISKLLFSFERGAKSTRLPKVQSSPPQNNKAFEFSSIELSREQVRHLKKDILFWYSSLPETLPMDEEKDDLSLFSHANQELVHFKRVEVSRQRVEKASKKSIHELFPPPKKKQDLSDDPSVSAFKMWDERQKKGEMK